MRRGTPSAPRARPPVAVLAAAICLGAPGCAEGPDLEVRERAAYGQDEVVGTLRVGVAEAYFEGDGRRIRIVQEAPFTAVALEPLLSGTAGALAELRGRRVRARGDLQDSVLWDAEVRAATD